MSEPAAAIDLTDLRLGMLARGFHPVPVMRFDATDKAAGKRPTLLKWEEVCATADEAEIRRWSVDPGQRDCLNTGLLCGHVIGLDIDVPDYPLACRINALADAMLPPTPLIRIGKSPKSLRAFRAEGVHTKASTPALFLPDGTKVQIEALGKGNHFVSFGTHPDTKLPYTWPHQSPLDVRFEDLPVLPAATLRAFLKAAEAGMRAAGARTEAEIKDAAEGKVKPAPRAPKKPPTTIRGNDFPPPTYDDVREALAAIPNRHDWTGWVKIGAAIYDALADDGKDLFTSWSEQSSRNDPDATRKKWKSFSRSKMNISDLTLFWEARQNGWKPQWERERDEAHTANGATPPPTEAPTPPADNPPPPPPPKSPVSAAVAEMNTKYMVVIEAGKTLVYEPTYDVVLNRRYYERITFEDLRKLYLNRRIRVPQGNGKTALKPVADVWLSHPDRRQFIGGVIFDPSGHHARPDKLNLWQGFAVKPRPGSWARLQEHILKIVCAGDKNLRDWLMGWMARLVQCPGEQGEVAVVMRGIEGCGKGTLAKALLHILGQHGMAISNAKHLTGNFNGHLRDTVLLFADEAFYAGNRAHVGILKALITEPTLAIEAKYQNVVQMPNYVHLMMASNEDWVIPASLEARRFMVLEVLAARANDTAYFAAIWGEMKNGGYEAMLHDLLNYI